MLQILNQLCSIVVLVYADISLIKEGEIEDESGKG